MAEKKILGINRRKLFSVKVFGPIIGVAVVLVILLFNTATPLFKMMETKVLDTHFRLKEVSIGEKTTEGATESDFNPRISRDIIIIGIDTKTLDDIGTWPFPRSVHSALIDSFSRIKRENERESSVFLDIFFINKASKAYHDIALIDSMKENKRVFLETVLHSENPQTSKAQEIYSRQEAMFSNTGEISQIIGDTLEMETYYSAEPPLKPYSEVMAGFGHANFYQDSDEIYRRQQLIAKYSVLMETLSLDDLTPAYSVDPERHQRLVWEDRLGKPHTVKLPLDAASIKQLRADMEKNAVMKNEDTDGDQKVDTSYYVIKKYQDHFVPSITLALALHYFNRTVKDIVFYPGKYILIPSPQQFNVKAGEWEPYRVNGRQLDELKIPVTVRGDMLVNYMGRRSSADWDGYKTYPVRSYSSYALSAPIQDPASWPETKALGNKILMVGAFALGMAEDEKTTPLGLMYGIEIHANALNTIIMNNFIREIPAWINLLILILLVMGVSIYSSRMNTGLSLLLTIVLVFALFITATTVFDMKNLFFDFAKPAVGTVLAFVSIVVYRVVREEKDKRRIKDMFGKYVSPLVVEQMMNKPPELGGVDNDITVFFSDIRSFTTLSESMSPQELVNLLNEYLTAMTDCLISFNGTLDKYIGDAIMCFWGAPLSQEDHAELACKCALKQMELLSELNQRLPESKRIQIGIGLNSGICTIGNMGSQGRMNYTVMGDNVNLSSRLEGINKTYYTHIVISENTYQKINGKGFIVRELDDIRVKGKRKPVRIYELIAYEGPLDPPTLKN